jgi:lipoyl synthase
MAREQRDGRHPPWLKVKLPGGGRYYDVRKRLGGLGVRTVCEEARCPNAAECWGCGTATFMILGETCTRGCRFCGVATGRPEGPPDPQESGRVAEAAAQLELRYVVLTSVDRDDLPDGGAGHFARTVAAIRARLGDAVVELLIPDFAGDLEALRVVVDSGAQVLGHNLETTRELTPTVRDPRCGYERSLEVLRRLGELAPERLTKSSLLVGLGETAAQLEQAMDELRAVGVDWLTMGQYLRPTRKHTPVVRYVPPEEFEQLGALACSKGFALVGSGPLVRSSYRAGEEAVAELLVSLSGRRTRARRPPA